jgi:hypothetical protein
MTVVKRQRSFFLSRDQLNLTMQLPSLNLRHQSGPSFTEQFRQYQASEEWTYFTEKKVAPLRDAYFQVLQIKKN